MKTTQDIIHEAAKEYEVDFSHPEQIKRDSFTDGATFALSTPELWREHAVKFANWYRDSDYIPIENGMWVDALYHTQHLSGEFTTDELFDLYIQHLKTQQ